MKDIEIIPLAEKKAEKRSIRKKQIEKTVSHPMQVVDGYGGRKVAQSKVIIKGKDYLLRVVYEEKRNKYLVVTTYLTSQISRYWKEENK